MMQTGESLFLLHILLNSHLNIAFLISFEIVSNVDEEGIVSQKFEEIAPGKYHVNSMCNTDNQ
jgi:hypothetical protein